MFTISNRNLNTVVLKNATKIEIRDIISPSYFNKYERKRNISIELLQNEKEKNIILAKKMLRAILTNKQFSINKNNSLISILNLLRG